MQAADARVNATANAIRIDLNDGLAEFSSFSSLSMIVSQTLKMQRTSNGPEIDRKIAHFAVTYIPANVLFDKQVLFGV